jgi:hypothetical protein
MSKLSEAYLQYYESFQVATIHRVATLRYKQYTEILLTVLNNAQSCDFPSFHHKQYTELRISLINNT